MSNTTNTEFYYSQSEERFNYWSHGIAAAVSVVGLIFLIFRGIEVKDGWLFAGFIIFGLSLIGVFTASTLYHIAGTALWKRRFRLLDHAMIYVTIAGSYTPFLLGTFREHAWAVPVFILMWSLCIGGIVFKLIVRNRLRNIALIDLFMYIMMACVAVFFIKPIFALLPTWGVVFLLGGGVSYLAGTFFYANHRIPFNHAIWHVFVIGGAFFHYVSIYFFVLPPVA